MRAVLKIAAVLALIAVAICGAFAFINHSKPAIVNTALETSGVKNQVEEALRTHVADIAAATGMSEEQVSNAINDLDISSWTATELPANAQETGSTDVRYQGVDATVTTYADPSYVTVEALGQTVTLSVPESAQQYVPLLGYLS